MYLKQIKKWLSGIITVCLLAGMFWIRDYPTVHAAAGITADDYLSVENGTLVNRKGKAVMLRGVNLGGWLIQESWMCPVNGEDRKWANLNSIEALQNRGFTQAQIQELFNTYQDNWITTYDLDIIADSGCNVIRVPFWYRNFMTDANGTWITQSTDDNPGFKKLDWVITEAGKRGMYVILDMHGCPGGQSMDHCSGTLAKNELYTNETYKVAMEKLWRAIASRYKGNPVVAAYDIMNEPQNNSGYSGSNSYDPWDPYSWGLTNEIYSRMIPAIRAEDPGHAITVEGIWRATNLPDPRTKGWTNMIYQVHLYDDTGGFETNARDTANLCKNYGVAGYVGEFSNMDGLNICNNLGLHWTTWTYKAGKNVGDWAWYQKNAEVADTRSDSFEEIKRKWGSALRTENGFGVNNNVVSKIRESANEVPDEDDSYIRYEAEDAVNNFGKVNTGNNKFSGGSFVGDMNTQAVIDSVSDISANWSNIPYVRFTVNVNEAGIYNMKIGYATQTATVYTYVRVNDDSSGSWKPLAFDTTSSWDSVKTTTLNVSLKKGSNTIWLSGSTRGSKNDNWINYDYIQLPKESSGNSDPDPDPVKYGPERFEAEAAMLNLGIVKDESSGNFSGGKHVGEMNTQTEINDVEDINADWSDIPYIKYTVEVPADGTYTMDIGFATQTPAVYGYIRINDEAASQWTTVTYNSTGSWNQVNKKTVVVDLTKGTNDIWLSGSTKGSKNDNWINYDYIDLTGKELVNPSSE